MESKILLGNNVAHMKKFAEGSIDFILTSPPYDDLRTYHGYVFDFNETAKEAYRVLRDGGVMVWNVADMIKTMVIDGKKVESTESLNSFRQAIFFQSIGFSVRTMIFKKVNYMPRSLDGSYYARSFEYIFVLTKGKPFFSNLLKLGSKNAGQVGTKTRYKKDGGKESFTSKVNEVKIVGDIFEYVVGNANNDDNTGHEAVFPELFARDMIYTWSDKGSLVYDMFGGSGTTAKVAELMGRRWITSEISEENCLKIKKRLEHYGKREIEIVRNL